MAVDVAGTRRVLKWLLNNEELSGCGRPKDHWIIERAEHIVCVCPYLKESVQLSSDTRMVRATGAEARAMLAKRGFPYTVLIFMGVRRPSGRSRCVLAVQYVFSNVGAQEYEFECVEDSQGSVDITGRWVAGS
jgi:hypothetical protein